MYDYTLLKERMKDLRMRQYDIAEAIGKSRATVSTIFKNDRELTQTEIIQIADLLGLKSSDIYQYFFKQKLKKT